MGQGAQSPPKAIIHPWIDGLAIGGLSIAFLTFLLIVQPGWNHAQVGKQFIFLAALLNWPHFMATYKLLYGSRETVERYPWSTIWMPVALGVYCLVAMVVAPYSELPLNLAFFVAGAYLAWHYTGQTWGMMATFSYLGGAPFEDSEKTWIRTSLRLLLTWHVVWFLFHTSTLDLIDHLEPYRDLYTIASLVLNASAGVLGIGGLARYIRRIGRVPPLRVIIPWVSIWMWYAVLYVFPYALFWVQLSHALQYLLFPARVEANRQRQKQKKAGDVGKRPMWVTGLTYAAILVGSGLALFQGLPMAFAATLGQIIPEFKFAYAQFAVVVFINIHHYFADGAIWKLSNPAVRKELFSHLP